MIPVLASLGGLIGAVALLLLASALARRRRGPAPLSRILLAGSLGAMQRPRPYRQGAEP
jgi:hypothetical protein